MKDFMNFEIVPISRSRQEVILELRHKKKNDIKLKFRVSPALSVDEIASLMKHAFRRYAEIYGAKTREALTDTERVLYEQIVRFYREEGRAPTYQEQCYMLGLRSRGATWNTCSRLVSKGWAWKDEKGSIVPVDVAPILL